MEDVKEKEPMIITEEYLFNFGKKHPGESIVDVLEIDPSYVQWCVDNLEWFEEGEWLAQALDDAYNQMNFEGADDGDRFSIY